MDVTSSPGVTVGRVLDLAAIAEQGYAIMLRHPWLPELVVTRPTLGPNGVALLEHVMEVLAGHPADGGAKLEIFALLNATVATFARNVFAGGRARSRICATSPPWDAIPASRNCHSARQPTTIRTNAAARH